MKSFYNILKNSSNEEEVSDSYIEALKKYIKYEKVQYIYNCDGFIKGTIKYDKNNRIIGLLMEFKYERNFYNKRDKCEVILQALYYIRSFIKRSIESPEVLLIGDKRTCFILKISDILDYLDMEINWNIAASESYKCNKKIIEKMISDDKINPFIFRIDNKFNIKDVVDEIDKLAKGIDRFIKVNEENIILAYDYFATTVIKNIGDYSAQEIVQIFILLLINPDECFKHINNKNILLLSNGKRVAINGENFDSYFKHFINKYKPSEVKKLTEISDRLIEDTYRRRNGEYYTPTTWVNKAHEYISKVMGANWKDEYVVWDCAWGTGNLTRDYKFSNLYCSTLDDEDLRIGEMYNKEAKCKFQYNFLDDDLNEVAGLLNYEKVKMPKELHQDLVNNEKILFLINPPFGTAGTGGAKGTSKKEISYTHLRNIMKTDGYGSSSQQLYVQFLYKILLIKRRYSIVNLNICFFSTPIFLTGESFKKFRKIFLKHFNFNGGFLFKASNFAEVKSNWGISFSMWSTELNKNNKFKYDILDYKDGQVKKVGTKILYNTDQCCSASKWVKDGMKKSITYDVPQFKNAITIKSSGNGRVVKDSLGYFVTSSNCVNENNTYVLITSSACCKGHGISITKDNIMKVVSFFAARKLITGRYSNWINIRDEYMKPNLKSDKYLEWNNDALIYSIFSNSSYQSSLRGVEYKGKVYNIKNNFFFESKYNLMKYADDFYNKETYNDAESEEKEVFIYELLSTLSFSKEAEDVLVYAKKLLKDSFIYRKEFSKTNPQYQLCNWDAGWYQIKALLNEYMKDELKVFKEKFRVLENKMRPMVYELGFLLKDM